MPIDKNGHWVPNPHKASQYTGKESSAANKLSKDFREASDLRKASQKKALQAKQRATTRTLQVMLTPTGQVKLVRAGRDTDNPLWPERTIKEFSPAAKKTVERRWTKHQLSKEFAKTRNNDRNRGYER